MPSCDTVREHNQTLRKALTYSARGGDYHASRITRRHPAACAPSWEQHQVAARAWAGGRGQSHWALTA